MYHVFLLFPPPFKDISSASYSNFLSVLLGDRRLHLIFSQDLMGKTFGFLKSLQKAQTRL